MESQPQNPEFRNLLLTIEFSILRLTFYQPQNPEFRNNSGKLVLFSEKTDVSLPQNLKFNLFQKSSSCPVLYLC